MTEQLEIAIAQDHLESLTKSRKAIHAIEELVWNALDADATRIEITLERGILDAVERIHVADNGCGIDRSQCQESFGSLGGSMKTNGSRTKNGRVVHGSEGKGRFRAFSLGRKVSWTSRYRSGPKISEFNIVGSITDLRHFAISDNAQAKNSTSGVVVTIDQLSQSAQQLLRDSSANELAVRLGLYLRAYPGIKVIYDGEEIDYSALQDYVEDYSVAVEVEDQEYNATLTVVEWEIARSDRRLYLCTKGGFALHDMKPGIQASGFAFTAYLSSPFFDTLDADAFLLSDLDPRIIAHVAAAKSQLRDHFRRRESERGSEVVAQWKEEDVYPFKGSTTGPVDTAERELFDVCALKVHEYLPSFRDSDKRSKRLTLNLLRQAIETGPSSIQRIFEEVLALPEAQREELAELLDKTTLASIIGAAKTVADRLLFLLGLEEILFSKELKRRVKERTQLHRILVNELWIFGEQYSLGTDDESLKSVLEKHVELLDRRELSPESVVKDLNDRNAIPDLMLYRSYPMSTPGSFEHLVVELKRPSCRLGQREISQIENYAFSIAEDERFDKDKTRWRFLLLGTDLDSFAKRRCSEKGKDYGHIHAEDHLNIHVAAWAEILSEAKWRHEFFREKLNYQATKPEAISYLRDRYSEYLPAATG